MLSRIDCPVDRQSGGTSKCHWSATYSLLKLAGFRDQLLARSLSMPRESKTKYIILKVYGIKLIKKANKPKVKIVIGRVSNTKRGLIHAFKIPITTATTKATVKDSTYTAGIKYALITTANVDPKILIKNFIYIHYTI